ncbi:polymer-forming cytoskeletal protein [Arcobacter sp. 15-2]|uniref:bactofilin family protein n=1 Tax=Arcobacter sp. 15-2 TaxID=3374109 RepID=UPI00399C6EA0
MGIFNKTNKKPKEQIGTTVISNGTTVKGVIDTKGSIFIDGKFEGIIVATEDVTIGKNGEVLGEIRSKILTVNGIIDGLFDVAQVNILGSGRVIGKIQYDELIIEQNGIFEGEGKKKNSTRCSQYNKLEVNETVQIES